MVEHVNEGLEVLGFDFLSILLHGLDFGCPCCRFLVCEGDVKRRVLIHHPRNFMISFKPPSVIIFQIDAGSGRLIGSNRLASGQKIRSRAMRAAWVAQATIFQLLEESMPTHTPSSM